MSYGDVLGPMARTPDIPSIMRPVMRPYPVARSAHTSPDASRLSSTSTGITDDMARSRMPVMLRDDRARGSLSDQGSGRARSVASVSERLRGVVQPRFEITNAALELRDLLAVWGGGAAGG